MKIANISQVVLMGYMAGQCVYQGMELSRVFMAIFLLSIPVLIANIEIRKKEFDNDQLD